MRRSTVILLVAGALTAAAGSAGAAALSIPGTLQHKTTSTPITEKVSKVVLKGDVGDLTVQGGTPAKVTSNQQWNLAAPTMTESIVGGVLTVTTHCPNVVENNCSVDVVVTLPESAAVDATAGVGTILTRGLIGPEALHANVGSVASSEVRATTYEARADVGDLFIKLPVAPTSTSLRTGTGDIHASVPPGRYALTTRVGTGDVQTSGVTDDPHAPRRLSARTGTGDIFITGR